MQFIGTGPTLNEATDNAMQRAAEVLHMTQAEVRNRCTPPRHGKSATIQELARFLVDEPNHHGVAKMLRRHRDELAATLDRLDGRREWGVKVLARSADLAVHVRATRPGGKRDPG